MIESGPSMGAGTAQRGLRWAVAAALLGGQAAGGLAAGWWNPSWPYRRIATVDPFEPTRLEGRDVAVVTLPTAGLIRPDGRDIRVATAGGKDVPRRVLMVGPGDRARVAFALKPGARKYYVYYGNDSAEAPEPLAIRRGVLLELWRNPDGDPPTLQQAREVLAEAKTLIGRGFRDRIFLGHNPYGPQHRIAGRFTAYLVCPADGQYVFATSSRNASFLQVDGELVVDNGGRHRPQRNIRVRGSVELDAGLHELTFHHVSSGGAPVAVVAWRPPGAERVRPIPPGAFAPVHRATAGLMHRYGRTVSVDFLPDWQGEAFVKDRYFQRWAFRAHAIGRRTGSVKWRWDFGDGQSSTAEAVEHVYLTPGRYTVTLTAQTFIGELKRTNRIFVSRPWDKVTQNTLDELSKHAAIVARYDFASLPAEDAAHAVVLLDRARMGEALLRAGRGLLAQGSAPAPRLQEALPIYAAALTEAGQPEAAARALQQAAGMTEDPAARAELLCRAGKLWLEELDRPDEAMKRFTQVVEKLAALTGSEFVRGARIGVGDVWRARGKYEKAEAAYEAVGPAGMAPGRRALIRKGDFARHVEAYIRDEKLSAAEEYLQRWARSLPGDKLEGYWSWMKVRYLRRRGRHEDAVREAETLVNVNPRSNYAPRLLWLAAESCRGLGEAEKAETLLRRLVADYPESPLSARGKAQLDGS